MFWPKKVLEGAELIERAKKLGVTLAGADDGRTTDAELQRRVMEVERHLRDGKLWILALLSALGAVFSALAAWFAVLR